MLIINREQRETFFSDISPKQMVFPMLQPCRMTSEKEEEKVEDCRSSLLAEGSMSPVGHIWQYHSLVVFNRMQEYCSYLWHTLKLYSKTSMQSRKKNHDVQSHLLNTDTDFQTFNDSLIYLHSRPLNRIPSGFTQESFLII